VTVDSAIGRTEQPGNGDEPGEAGPGPVGGATLMRLLAHETRTPLNAIRGFTEMLLSGAAGALREDALEHLREIAQAALALEHALHLLQELAELDGQGGPRAAEPVDLGRILRELGFVLAAGGEGAAPLPAMLGEAAIWRRIGAACRAHLLGSAPGEAAVIAEYASGPDGGLELVLHRPDIRRADGLGLLAIELASRLAAGQGSRLTRRTSEAVTLAWPAERIVVPATGTGADFACCVRCPDGRHHPPGEGR
jgi:hypothetical protein